MDWQVATPTTAWVCRNGSGPVPVDFFSVLQSSFQALPARSFLTEYGTQNMSGESKSRLFVEKTKTVGEIRKCSAYIFSRVSKTPNIVISIAKRNYLDSKFWDTKHFNLQYFASEHKPVILTNNKELWSNRFRFMAIFKYLWGVGFLVVWLRHLT